MILLFKNIKNECRNEYVYLHKVDICLIILHPIVRDVFQKSPK